MVLLHHQHLLASGCALHTGAAAADTAVHRAVLAAAAVLMLEPLPVELLPVEPLPVEPLPAELLFAELLLAELLLANLLLPELLLLEPLLLRVVLLLVEQVLLPAEPLLAALLAAARWPAWLPVWLLQLALLHLLPPVPPYVLRPALPAARSSAGMLPASPQSSALRSVSSVGLLH